MPGREPSDALRVEVRLPVLLAQLVGGERCVEVHGATLAEVLADLARRRPALALHLFDESGAMRGHILCASEGRCVRGRDGLDLPIGASRTLRILNSVSGG